MLKNVNPTDTIAWAKLTKKFTENKNIRMKDLFAGDKNRFKTFSRDFEGEILLDFSKNLITEEILADLIALAEEMDLKGAIKAMFSGEKINKTEGRAVLHTALRNRSNREVFVDGKNVMPKINAVLDQMKAFCAKIHCGGWKGYTGKKITDVVNIGIGGSDLGPVMVTEALKKYNIPNIRTHFISNVDGTHIAEILKIVNPENNTFSYSIKNVYNTGNNDKCSHSS